MLCFNSMEVLLCQKQKYSGERSKLKCLLPRRKYYNHCCSSQATGFIPGWPYSKLQPFCWLEQTALSGETSIKQNPVGTAARGKARMVGNAFWSGPWEKSGHGWDGVTGTAGGAPCAAEGRTQAGSSVPCQGREAASPLASHTRAWLQHSHVCCRNSGGANTSLLLLFCCCLFL